MPLADLWAGHPLPANRAPRQSVAIVRGSGVPEAPAGSRPQSILAFLKHRGLLCVGVHATATPGGRAVRGGRVCHGVYF